MSGFGTGPDPAGCGAQVPSRFSKVSARLNLTGGVSRVASGSTVVVLTVGISVGTLSGGAVNTGGAAASTSVKSMS